ncbi:acetyltransferase [Flavobacterium sandaracinum]|uniref:Acetyltransferase n=1 Tax=Flavobacterium sandaracinum TaxID=2541733 RepID=A0A4R5D3L9_9FLAO|nr:acetyltransferase [Flavobacterium sandaracinum]TDE04773.1 acetyltransferase [Flavobacterium sandaracinum]
MKNIAIIGAGGFGREVKTILDSINKVTPSYFFVGFYDDGLQKGEIVNGFPVLGGVEDINEINEDCSIVIAIGDPKIKFSIFNKIRNTKIDFPNIIHPNVLISDDFVDIGVGNIICAGCIITCNIVIKDFVILNLMCTVGHDTTIASFSSFMPSVNISGEVLIEERVYVGTGAKIINQLEIGQNTIVGAGAVVSKSLPENCTAVGIPAKPIKFHDI